MRKIQHIDQHIDHVKRQGKEKLGQERKHSFSKEKERTQ